MIGLGIFLFIMGISCLSSGGDESGICVILIIVGLGLFIRGLVTGGKNSNTGDSVNSLKKKIALVIKFYENMIETMNLNDVQTKEYENILKALYQMKNMAMNLNQQGVDLIDSEYDRVSTIYNDLYDKINSKYESLDDVPISFDFDELKSMIRDSEEDLSELITVNNLLNYLLLISNTLSVSKQGYSEYLTENLYLPDTPKKIHVYAMSCFITKSLIDGNDDLLFKKLKSLLDDVDSDADCRKTLRKFFKLRLSNLKKMYEKEEDDAILAILVFVDPSSTEQYDKKRKFYETLGLSKDASGEEIERAYKKILITSHPDRGGDVNEWTKINEAYIKIKNK